MEDGAAQVILPQVSSGSGFTAFGYHDDTLSLLSPTPFAQRRKRRPTRDYHGVSLGGWMLSGELTVGPTYSDNIYFSSVKPVAAAGVRLQPRFAAYRETGIHRTKVYGAGDFTLVPAVDKYNLINGQIGFAHVWEVKRDLLVKFQGQADHFTSVYGNAGAFLFGESGLGVLPIETSARRDLQKWNVLTGSVAALKSFDRVFVGMSVNSALLDFEPINPRIPYYASSRRHDFINWVTARVGYRLIPSFYVFSEGSGSLRDFYNFTTPDFSQGVPPATTPFGTSEFSAHGYRAVAGLGIDRGEDRETGDRLLRGEVYAGFQQQFYQGARYKSVEMPVIGGSVTWRPTRPWTISALATQYIQDAFTPTTGNVLGSPAKAFLSQVRIGYALSQSWSASVFGGYLDYKYVKAANHSHSRYWQAGANLSYEIWRNLDARLEYNYFSVISGTAGNSYDRNQITLGATYKY
jgi:opacity protein-like surface antigen